MDSTRGLPGSRYHASLTPAPVAYSMAPSTCSSASRRSCSRSSRLAAWASAWTSSCMPHLRPSHRCPDVQQHLEDELCQGIAFYGFEPKAFALGRSQPLVGVAEISEEDGASRDGRCRPTPRRAEKLVSAPLHDVRTARSAVRLGEPFMAARRLARCDPSLGRSGNGRTALSWCVLDRHHALALGCAPPGPDIDPEGG